MKAYTGRSLVTGCAPSWVLGVACTAAARSVIAFQRQYGGRFSARLYDLPACIS